MPPLSRCRAGTAHKSDQIFGCYRQHDVTSPGPKRHGVDGAAPNVGLATQAAKRLVGEIGSVLAGSPEVLRASVACLLARGHLMIEDVPGVGKTVLARALAAAAGVGYSRVQCTADLLPSDVTGISIYHEPSAEFRFQPGPVFANLVLVDEINRASPRTQSALLEAMEESQVTVDGITRPLPRPFMVVATQNPVEYEGTFPLPEAQLDRFMMRLHLGYPGADDEARLLLGQSGAEHLSRVEPVSDESGLRMAMEAVDDVHVDPSIADYVVQIAAATRADERLMLGVSPRGSLMVLRAAKAWALLADRDYVLPDDIQDLTPVVLAHRLVLEPSARTSGDATDILAQLLDRTPVPRSI